MAEFGGGIDLTSDLDITLNGVGDLQTISGQDELAKDLALQSIIELENIDTRRKTNETKTTVKRIVRDIVIADPRIDRLLDIDVRFNGTDSIEIITDVLASDEEQELVFSLPT